MLESVDLIQLPRAVALPTLAMCRPDARRRQTRQSHVLIPYRLVPPPPARRPPAAHLRSPLGALPRDRFCAGQAQGRSWSIFYPCGSVELLLRAPVYKERMFSPDTRSHDLPTFLSHVEVLLQQPRDRVGVGALRPGVPLGGLASPGYTLAATHSLARLLAHSLAHSLTHSLTHPLTRSFARSLIQASTTHWRRWRGCSNT